MKNVAEKMGIKPGMRAILVHAPEDIDQTIGLSKSKLATRLSGYFDYIHFFAMNQADLRKNFSRLKNHLKDTAMLWISWQKNGQRGTDLSLPHVIKIGYDEGLVESKTLAVDPVWSAMKFTFPKRGKTYNNSFGKLKKSALK